MPQAASGCLKRRCSGVKLRQDTSADLMEHRLGCLLGWLRHIPDRPCTATCGRLITPPPNPAYNSPRTADGVDSGIGAAPLFMNVPTMTAAIFARMYRAIRNSTNPILPEHKYSLLVRSKCRGILSHTALKTGGLKDWMNHEQLKLLPQHQVWWSTVPRDPMPTQT